MSKKVLVLGCGLVGQTIAIDLANDERIECTVADSRKEILEKAKGICSKLHSVVVDLGDEKTLIGLISPFDLIVGALPSFLGFSSLKTVINAGKNYCDISFMAEDYLSLNNLAKEKGSTVFVDIGVAPGLSHILSIYGSSLLNYDVDKVNIYVGGLPKDPKCNDFQYKATWSPADVLLEFTRPVYIRRDGVLVEKPAISDPEILSFPHVDTPLESFLTDGLRSLHKYLPNVKNLEEKTLRYPGHIQIMKILRDCGFLSENEVKMGDTSIVPIRLTEKLLLPHWKLDIEKDVEFTVMKVICEKKGGKKAVFDLYDETDVKNKVSSMSRTTGFTCAIAARMILFNQFSKKGVFSPEVVGEDPNLAKYLFDELTKRNVKFSQHIENS